MNQSSKDEKSHQVGLMRDIFSRATSVTLFLGGDEDTPEARLLERTSENLFYKGVYKHKVDPARLSQTHGQDLPLLTNDAPELETDGETSVSQPPYLFHNGASLLEMARKHNVSDISYVIHGMH